MKSTVDCIYCYLRQAVNCMRHANTPMEKQPEILYDVMDMIKTFDMDCTPCYNSTFSILRTYALCGNMDPFEAEKKESNEKASYLLESISKSIDMNDLHKLLVLSSAGNIIDTGIMFEYDIGKTMIETLESGFSVDHYPAFEEKLAESSTVLYIGDNCGEIVFDLPVVKFLSDSGKKVYYAVKSSPILNDALLSDALYAGIDRYAEIVETGSGFLGVSFENSSPGFLALLTDADLVISKGQANFESLDDYADGFCRLFFILKIKCDRVAELIEGSKYGDSVFFTMNKE
ncbi:MAG: ARMT1-like domain-containing protein [Clostridia bacterium]